MDSQGYINIAAAVLGGGSLAALLQTWLNRKRPRAEVRSLEVKGELQIVDAATEMVSVLREEVKRLSAKQLEQQKQIDGLRQENATLREQERKSHDMWELKYNSLRSHYHELQGKFDQLEKENAELKVKLESQTGDRVKRANGSKSS